MFTSVHIEGNVFEPLLLLHRGSWPRPNHRIRFSHPLVFTGQMRGLTPPSAPRSLREAADATGSLDLGFRDEWLLDR